MSNDEKEALITSLEEKLGCPLSTLAELLQETLASSPQKEENSLTEEVSSIMHELGIPAHLVGYTYIRECILKTIEDPDIMRHVTSGLYPYIAVQNNTTVNRVERGIRTAIEIAWNRGNTEVMQKIFGYSVSFDKGKPTNSEFIAMVADYLQMQRH